MLVAANSSGTNRFLERLGAGRDPSALAELFARHRERLRRMIRLRLDPRLRGRVSSSELLDRVYADASERIANFPATPGQSFFLWLRELVARRIDAAHRQHFGEHAGEPSCEIHLYRGSLPGVTAASMAAQLLGDQSANQEAARVELLLRLQGALNGMDQLDREILALRNFEELKIEEAAAVLGMSKSAATVRYLQAVKRLNDTLASIPGFLPRRPA
jgi:RNA polymerase sigma-70 factor (ECF subfamily)